MRTSSALALWRRHPLLVSTFVLATALTLFFALRLTVQAVYWSNHRDEVITPWMTPGYVAHSWDVPIEELEARVGLQRPQGKPQPLAVHAGQQHIPVTELIDRIEAAIADIRAERDIRHGVP